MYQIPYFALAGLLVTFGVPVALMAACGLAQLRLAQTLNPLSPIHNSQPTRRS